MATFPAWAASLDSTTAMPVFTDIPDNSWAKQVIASAQRYGLIGGIDEGTFGYGQAMTRAEFVAVLCRMFDWALESPPQPAFEDISQEQWYYPYIETAAAHGVVEPGLAFKPQDPVSRMEMAVMLVKSLGYQSLADQISNFGPPPFNDLDSNQGYIAIAYDIGMVGGVNAGLFAPDQTAAREEAAAMLVRVYEKYMTRIDWLHGFYAFSSYEQRYVAQDMDTISLAWGQMQWDEANGAQLNTSASGGNQWRIPNSYEDIIGYLDQYGVGAHFSVYMDTSYPITLPNGLTSNSLNEMLTRQQGRNQAVSAIINEVTRLYGNIGKNPYRGVTIDFEGLRGESVKAGYTQFLTELATALKARNLSLYVTVQPVTPDDQYFDGFDYRSIGRLADKIILMAHDYHPASLEGFVGTQWQKNTPLTPITHVYYALKAIINTESGVEDSHKVVLAISFSAIGWEITEDDKILTPVPVQPSVSTVNTRLQQHDTLRGWSETYRNPYLTYYTESGQRFFLWYEDIRSVAEKINLAKLFGIHGISLWRIGIIPDYEGAYDVWSDIRRQLR
jgi:hypothetical protein